MTVKSRVEDTTAADTDKSLMEAEIAVASSIAVREGHKAKLRTLLSTIAQQVLPNLSYKGQICFRSKSLSKFKPGKTRGGVEVNIQEGKDIHVLGDLLLLTRAASVDVVENIQTWRAVVHQGKPRPYMYENENYLLYMCEDLDFLDQAADLVEWLGFRLLRNPFIVNEALDDVVSSRLALNVHDARSLKFWCSPSWKVLYNERTIQKIDPPAASGTPQSTQQSKARWKKQPPPAPLVKPLASIDDVVDGSRISRAQEVLLEEESFHGRLLALRAAQQYVDRGPSLLESNDADNNAALPNVYDAIAALNVQLRSKECRLSLIRRERAQAERAVQDLRNQVRWTELRRDCDHTKDHRVWSCRDKYRQGVLKTYTRLTERLERCLLALKGDERCIGGVLDNYKGKMSELRREKDKLRTTRHKKKQQEEASKRKHVRLKAEMRGSKFRSKKKLPELNLVHERKGSVVYEDITAEIQSDVRLIEKRRLRDPGKEQVSSEGVGTNDQLEEKRQRSIYQKRARLEQQARSLKEKELGLERRRAENVAMKWEDGLARVLEREARRKTILRLRKARMEGIASCAMFKGMHEMNGKRFVVSVFTRNARGYDLEGIRIVAYDPSSSATFTMVMTLREFNSLGYGRTSDGLGGFCQWLCLLYEKRRRQFRLIWSGTPCPPPLRIREYDQSLFCIHKEGVKLRYSFADSYCLVAVYLRTVDQSTLRFVMGSCHGHEFALTEHAVSTRWLVVGSDLDVQWKSSTHAVIVWKHHAHALKMQEGFYSSHEDSQAKAQNDVGPRIYSSEISVKRVRYSVHLYDTDETTYTVELIPKPPKGKGEQDLLPRSVDDRLIIDKRDVNPYGVHLSSSNFADLLSLISFEQTEPSKENFTSDATTTCLKWKATVSPKWAGKLVKYVRVLRLAKYACKIGGVFCLVAIFVVQQKTEFRAHLLLELTWLAPTPSSSFSLGGQATRQSLRIALSDYLRCINASHRFAGGMGYKCSEQECPSCSAYDAQRTKLYENDPVPETTFDYAMTCSNCVMIQHRRLHAMKQLIGHASTIALESLELIYHAYCDVCTTLVPPIVLVVGSAFSTTMLWLLEHYFASFDCTKHGFLQFSERDQGHAIAQESLNIRETFLQTLSRDQVVVLFNADCGVTVASANLFAHELHWWLYPDCTELPCHVAYVVGDPYSQVHAGNDFDQNAAGGYRDHDLLSALQALNHGACQVGEFAPTHLDDGDEEESDYASAFDTYMVSEAVLVEATRVLLQPEYAWQKPRKIVGASSWSSACTYLLDPVGLSTGLQRCDPLTFSAATGDVLAAYFAHEKWPQDYPDVRSVFHGLLAFMMHVQHVCLILGPRSGSLQIASTRTRSSESDMSTEHQELVLNTSVIDCSLMGYTTELPVDEVISL